MVWSDLLSFLLSKYNMLLCEVLLTLTLNAVKVSFNTAGLSLNLKNAV